MTDVPELSRVSVGGFLGRSDHSYTSVNLSTSVRVPGICSSRVVFQKSRVQWDLVSDDLCALSTSSLRRVDDPLSLLDDRLLAIVGARVPKATTRARSKDKVWFNAECRLAFDQKQTAYYFWSRNKTEANWQNFVRLRSAANRCYAQAKRAYHGRCQDALVNASNHHS